MPALLLCIGGNAFAQSDRPLRIVVAAAAGGPSDFVARLLAPRLGEALHQNIVVDNRASANGVAGADIAAKAAPDGLTLAVGNSGTHAINAALYKHLPYDPLRDFAPISQLVVSPMVLAATPRLQFNTVADMIAAARRDPNRLNIAIAGASGQLAGEALKAQMKISLNNVPYKGGVPATLAVIAGESDVSLLTLQGAITQINAGRIKALGVTTIRRTPALPNVPTIAESGVEGFDFGVWHGLFAPARTPDAIVRKLNTEVVRILNLPESKQRVAPEGYEVIAGTPEQFAAVLKREVERYQKIVADAGIPRE
jgi:tripartite-type tricarboxylate transporter receptor subunit TctC